MKKHWYHVTFMLPIGAGSTKYTSMSFGFDRKDISGSNIKFMQDQAGMAGSNIIFMGYLGYMTLKEFEE